MKLHEKAMARPNKKEDWRDHALHMGLLLALAVWVNRGIEIKGLYMDDLYFWSCYGEQSFFQYIFPMGSTRFRFLFYLAAYLEMALIGNHIQWIVPINIIANAIVAWTLYGIGRRISRSKGVGFLCGAMYLMSRMAYYQIGQTIGMMETMALWMAVVILYLLYKFLNGPYGKREFTIACGLYFGICFVHERYMALLPLFFLVLLFKRTRRLYAWLLPAGVFLLVQAIRMATIGTVLPAGTGGTQVADTFGLSGAVRYGINQIAYVFGINAGPEYLNGCSWWDSPLWVRVLVIAADLMVAAVVAGFLVRVIREKKDRVIRIQNCVLFVMFIGLCIACSSVTIRLEMRWVYVSLAGALLLLAYLYGVLTDGIAPEFYLKRLWPWGLAFAAYLLLMFPVELFYRSCYPSIYLWPDQMRYNSLAEQTYEKYGDRIFGKTIYIIGDSYQMSDFTARTFFKVFDEKRAAAGTRVCFADSIRDFGLVTDQMLVLREEPEFNGFQDITEFVRNIKLKVNYGYYGDGWMDERAELELMAGATGDIELEFMYPGQLNGGEMIQIRVNGKTLRPIEVKQNVTHATLEAEPWQMVELEFNYNFYVHNAKEQRGADKLAAIVNITAQ